MYVCTSIYVYYMYVLPYMCIICMCFHIMCIIYIHPYMCIICMHFHMCIIYIHPYMCIKCMCFHIMCIICMHFHMCIIYTSRGSPPSASFHRFGALLTTFLWQQFYDGPSTITILVDIMMLGQCMLPVILKWWMTILSLMECIASDYQWVSQQKVGKGKQALTRWYTLICM